MTDVDLFKSINDTRGRSVGDAVLRKIAALLTRQCRQSDCLSRYGGDEFAILCPGVDVHGAAEVSERCRRHIEKMTIPAVSEDVHVTMSFGAADSSKANSVEELIDKADRALYKAKRAGRNRVALHGPKRPRQLAAGRSS